MSEKEFISEASTNKNRNKFFFGTGINSIKENIELIKYAMEYNFKDFNYAPAYYKENTDDGVFNFYSKIISSAPKLRIILYNFEKLSGYKFSPEMVTKLVEAFSDNIVGCKF